MSGEPSAGKKRRHQRTAGAAGLPAENHQREGGRGISAEPLLLAGRCLSHAQTPLVIPIGITILDFLRSCYSFLC
jgi:hypothetical protein